MLAIREITKLNYEDTVSPCKSCLYWQTDDSTVQPSSEAEAEKKKREWFEKTFAEFGSCIMNVCLGEKPIGFVQYAPARFFRKIREYASGPPTEDAVFIACLYIFEKEARGKGHGSAILRELIKRFSEKNFKIVETFARKSCPNNPSGPLRLYIKQGFGIVRDEDDFPLVRMEL